jgi:hypothetical protein
MQAISCPIAPKKRALRSIPKEAPWPTVSLPCASVDFIFSFNKTIERTKDENEQKQSDRDNDHQWNWHLYSA